MTRDLVDVKALVSLEYDGCVYPAGTWFKARPVDALMLGQAGRVSLNREYGTKVSKASAEPAPKSSRRSYKRRDLTAERS